MSFGRRIFNIAKGEIRGVFSRKEAADEEMTRLEAELAALREKEPPREAPRRDSAPVGAPVQDHELRVNTYYANLELPIGASAQEVRAAYRRLIRQYHPDRHLGDTETERAATEVAHKLREAYEGLLRHLEKP